MVNHEFSYPVYIAKGVATSGHFSDLGPLVLGIYDRKTSSVATASGNGREFFLAGGSPHTKDSLTKFYKGMKTPKKSSYFYGKDLISFEKSYPVTPRNEEWVIGYDGSTSSKTLAYECSKQYQLKIRLFGEPAYQKFNKTLEKVITLNTPCCEGDDCSYDCPDRRLGVKAQTIQWVKNINEHIELQELKIKAYPVFSDYAVTAPNTYKYTLTTYDNGDAEGLHNIQRAYPTLEIERISFDAGRSTYQVENRTSAPANYTPKSSVLTAICGDCPAGYTLSAATDTWIIRRQVDSTTDLDDATSQQTFADSIVTAYTAAGAITGSGTFYGISEGAANIKVNFAPGSTPVTAAGTSDQLESLATTPERCWPDAAATPIAWVQSAAGYTVTRQYTITTSDDECEENYTAAQVEAFMLANSKSFVPGSATDITGSDACTKSFRITQRSKYMEDVCMSPDVANYEELPAFEGHVWQPVPEADEPFDGTIKAGIRITAPFYSVEFDDASFSPDEYYDAEPLRMEVSLYDVDFKPCKFADIAEARRTIKPRYRSLYGEEVIRQYLAQGVYFPYEDWSNESRLREILDITALSTVNRKKYYVAYFLKFKEARDNDNFDKKSQIFEPIIYVEQGDALTQAALEKALLAVTAKFNVGIENRHNLVD